MTATKAVPRSVERGRSNAGDGDVTLIDIRSSPEFCRGHIPGSINVSFSARGLADRIRFVVPDAGRLTVIGSHPDETASAYEQILEAGWQAPDVLSVRSAAVQGVKLEPLIELRASELVSNAPANPVVLDVREPLEWDTGHIPGATLISLGDLPARIDELNPESSVIVICEGGVRSATGASLLQAAGFSHVAHVADGTAAYRRLGLPLVLSEDQEGRD